MQQLGLESEEQYYARLRGEASRIVEAELRNLLNLVTVTETCFFRDASQFQLFRERIMPTLVAARSASGEERKAIRIWSAGCSSGEEAYSIAITLADMGLYRAHPHAGFEIVGTDLNSDVLEKARRGAYSGRAVRNVEGRLLDVYFAKDGRNFQLNEDVRNRVRFEFGNITQTPMPSTGLQDVIFCKNVAIYFRSEVTEKLVRGLRDTLAPGGYLLLGHAESLWQMEEGFELVEHERAFCYRKPMGLQGAGFKGSGFQGSTFQGSAFRSSAYATAGSVKESRTSELGTSEPGAFDDPADTSARYDLCLAAFRAGDWTSAETGLTALIGSCPTFVPAHLLLGGVYTHRARFDEAMSEAESVLHLTDLEPRAHLLLGMIAARRQRTEDALQSLRRALYLDDTLALAHFWLGNLYRDRGDFVRACHEYENVVGDWERRTFSLTEEFASDLTGEQLVEFCRDSLKRLHANQTNG
jgi:chemotaxis protein methyltransferase CheR